MYEIFLSTITHITMVRNIKVKPDKFKVQNLYLSYSEKEYKSM
jgi:hypothetical protein